MLASRVWLAWSHCIADAVAELGDEVPPDTMVWDPLPEPADTFKRAQRRCLGVGRPRPVPSFAGRLDLRLPDGLNLNLLERLPR